MNRESDGTPCDRSRLLVTDDNDAVRGAIGRILAHWLDNCSVDLAVNGLEALQSFREHHQGVVLMDLKMPVMDGETAYAEICRTCEENRWEMPSVVFCSGYMPPDGVRRIATANSPHRILQKPVRPDLLVSTIKERLTTA